MDYDNTNRGALWGNKKKDSEKHPDYVGSVNVEGVDYWISGWKRKPGANENSPALSLSIKLKEQKREQAKDYNKTTEDTKKPFDDDLPF